MGEVSTSEFLREYSRALNEDRAAVFIGAGFSIGAGFVDWRDLLRDVATDLGLDIDEEHDLLAVAQYEVNRKGGRDSLDRKILQRFHEEGQLTENHRLLARLPLDIAWTTNYDTLLEQAFEGANKRIDVKYEVEHLKHRLPYTDAVLLKIHGDVSKPGAAVITKDDYEKFELARSAFTDQLKLDLLSRQFLFLGFSFTDPNIEYTFNRLRRIIDPAAVSPREHYCVLRRPKPTDSIPEDSDQYRREVKRFEHRITDLGRFGVQVVPIDDYTEITRLLEALNRRVNTRNVMISGAAHDFTPFGRDRVESFCRALGATLIRRNFNLVSGFGLGISGAIILGAHEEVARARTSRMGQRLRLYPFPYDMPDGPEKTRFYDANRAEMISQAGAIIIIAGNKYDADSGAVIESPGVMREYELARDARHICIPIAATGHAAESIWKQMSARLDVHFPGLDVVSEWSILADAGASDEELINAALSILQKAQNHYAGAP